MRRLDQNGLKRRDNTGLSGFTRRAQDFCARILSENVNRRQSKYQGEQLTPKLQTQRGLPRYRGRAR